MIPKHIIEKAIAGGWNPAAWWPKVTERLADNLEAQALTALSPDFWIALGKECGWAKDNVPYLCEGCQTIGWAKGNHMRACPIKNRKEDVDTYAHRFYDLILRKAAQEEIDLFWESISKK